jgi:hypothetical protein
MAIKIPLITEFDGGGIDKAVKQFKQLETAGEKAQFAIKKAAIPAAAALGGLAFVAKDAVSAASDLAEAQSKVGIIFGKSAADIEKFAKTAATSIGQSERAVYDAAGTFGVFAQAAGLSGQDLSKFSTQFITLASDLASFNNTKPEEAINAIGAALRGESEPIRQYGVLLNDAAVKAKAMEMGLYEGTGALDAQAKVLATTSLIFEQTKNAQGDFERTSGGLANSTRSLTAQMEDFQASLGQALLPVIQAILPLIKSFSDWAQNNETTFKILALAIAGIAAAIVTANVAMKAWAVATTVATGAQAAFNAVMSANPIVLATAAIVAIGAAVVVAYNKFETFRDIVDGFGNVLKTAFLGAAEAVKTALNIYIGVYKTLVNAIADVWNNTVGKLSFRIPGWVPGIGGAGFDVPEIPKLADGGIVTGPTLALIGEAGPEAVIPLDRMGSGATNVTINVNGADPNAVVRALQQYVRQSGPVPLNIRTM